MKRIKIKEQENGLIDVHTHCGGLDLSNLYHNKYPYTQDIADLYKKGSTSGVSNMIVFPMPTTLYYDTPSYWKTHKFISSGFCEFPYQYENNYLLSCVKNIKCGQNLSEYFLPFLSFSLQDKVSEQMNELYRQLMRSDVGVYGFKYHTSADQKSVLNIETDSDILSMCTEYDIPIQVHTGFLECSSPIGILTLAAKYPHIRFCAAHFASFDKTFFKELESYNNNNLFFDTSASYAICKSLSENLKDNTLDLDYSSPASVVKAMYELFPKRILWGTDSPWINYGNLSNDIYIDIREYGDELEYLPQGCESRLKKNTINYLFGVR